MSETVSEYEASGEVPMSPRASVPALAAPESAPPADAPVAAEPMARWDVGLIPWDYPPGTDGMTSNGWEPLQVIEIGGVRHLVVRRRLVDAAS